VQQLQTAANQGGNEARLLASKAGELESAVRSLRGNVAAIVTSADEIDQASANPATDVQTLKDETHRLSTAARELAKAVQRGGVGNPWATPLSCFALLWLGCMAGVWLSFGYRKTLFQFDDLIVIEADRLEPTVRLVFAGLMTLLIGAFFYKKAITIVVGEVSTAQIADDPMIALILGAVCGFSELVLGTKVAQRAGAFLDWK
jgi:hypothetical protein